MGRIETRIELPQLPINQLSGLGSANKLAFWNGVDTLSYDTKLEWSSSTLSVDGSILSTALTASRVVVSDANKKLASSNVTSTELSALSGISPGQTVQDQLDDLDTELDAQNDTYLAFVADFNALNVSTRLDDLESETEAADNLELGQNFIHNAAFSIMQTGGTLSSLSTTNHLKHDRWIYRGNNGGTWTVTQSTIVPTAAQAGYGTRFSLKFDNTGTSTVAATTYSAIHQVIEGEDYARIKGKICTLSFWVRAVKTGIYCVAFQSANHGYSYVAEYTISAADTWEKKSVTLDLSPTVEESNYAPGSKGLHVFWTLYAGSNFQAAAGSWQAGVLYCTSNQVNGGDSTSNDFYLALPMFNLGDAAAAFKLYAGDSASELFNVLRFLEYSGEGDPSGILNAVNSARAYTLTTTKTRAAVRFQVEKISTPTVTIYASDSGTANKFRNVTTSADLSASVTNAGKKAFHASSTDAVTVGDDVCFGWSADARLTY